MRRFIVKKKTVKWTLDTVAKLMNALQLALENENQLVSKLWIHPHLPPLGIKKAIWGTSKSEVYKKGAFFHKLLLFYFS